MSGLFNITIADLITRAIVLLIAMDIHEFAHAYIAYQMGDTTARDMGRMTLNPFVNLYWPGYIMGVLLGFGILGTAPVNEYRMRDRRWGLFWAVAAGPIANLLLAAVFAIPVRLGLVDLYGGYGTVIPTASQFFTEMIGINLLLAVFNLIPLAPLDGWTVMLKLVPPDLAYTLKQYERESTFLLFALVFIPWLLPQLNILSLVIMPPVTALFRLLVGI
jgi:Zn-dependent protease